MKKHIILSVNWNPDYLFYLPLCVWAWKKFGWEPIVFYGPNYQNKANTESELVGKVFNWAAYKEKWFSAKFLENLSGYRSDTITQVSRLYGACLAPDDSYLMTGDIDMIPLSDYWHPDQNEITIYGHDLTGYGNYPICYIGMPATRWTEVMGLSSNDYNALIERDLKATPKASSERWEDYWETDQDLITKRINEVQFPKTFIRRGQYPNGYAFGRVDRGNWRLDHNQFIDAHLLRDIHKNPEHLAKTLLLLYKIWPQEDFTWFSEYTVEYGKIAKRIYG